MGKKIRMVKSLPVLPVREYAVQVVGLEMKEEQFGPAVIFRLEVIDDEEFAGRKLSAMASLGDEVTPKHKFTKWLAAFGVPFAEETELDIEELIGKEALATVVVTEKNGDQFNKITEMRSIPDEF